MRRSRIAAAVVVAAAVLAGPLSGAARADDPARESVRVTGTGEVTVTPDTMTGNFGVETNAATVGTALEQANAAAKRMRDALTGAGVAPADLQTSDVNVTSRQNEAGQITGYVVSQGLTARIREMAKAGELLSAAITAGGDAARLHGVTYGVEDDAAVLGQARKKAFADAKNKAQVYAGEAGRKLGRVVGVSEQTPGFDGQGGDGYRWAADAAVPVEPGRQTVTVTVTVEWAFES